MPDPDGPDPITGVHDRAFDLVQLAVTCNWLKGMAGTIAPEGRLSDDAIETAGRHLRNAARDVAAAFWDIADAAGTPPVLLDAMEAPERP